MRFSREIVSHQNKKWAKSQTKVTVIYSPQIKGVKHEIF